MSRRRQELDLPLACGEVEEVIGEVAASLGWSIEPAGPEGLELHEDPTKLHCHCAPLSARMIVRRVAADATALRIEGRVAGWGPVASQHVREQTDLLARQVGLAAVARAGGDRLPSPSAARGMHEAD